MAKKFNFGFVGQNGLTKVGGCSTCNRGNNPVFLVVEKALFSNCSSPEDIFNSKQFFELGKKICKKYGLDATIVCSFFKQELDDEYVNNFCFDVVSLKPNVVRSVPENVMVRIDPDAENTDDSEENAYLDLIEKYEVASFYFKDNGLNGRNVFIEKKHGKYLTHGVYEYDGITWSSVCSEEVAKKIFMAYIDALPLKLRKLSEPCCCFGAVGATGICADCHKESEEK